MSAPFELPLAPPSRPSTTDRPVASISRERYVELARRVRLLSWLSLGAMSVEGFVAIALAWIRRHGGLVMMVRSLGRAGRKSALVIGVADDGSPVGWERDGFPDER